MKAKTNMRIQVYSSDKSKDLGYGTIIRVEDMIDDDTGEVFSSNFPIIRLDNGEEMTGLDCWWKPVQEA